MIPKTRPDEKETIFLTNPEMVKSVDTGNGGLEEGVEWNVYDFIYTRIVQDKERKENREANESGVELSLSYEDSIDIKKGEFPQIEEILKDETETSCEDLSEGEGVILEKERKESKDERNKEESNKDLKNAWKGERREGERREEKKERKNEEKQLKNEKKREKEKDRDPKSDEEDSSKYKFITKRIDSTKIFNKKPVPLEVMSSQVKDIRMEVSGPVRSGAIIFTKTKRGTFFCMGTDGVYGDLTDFAGGVKKGESAVVGGLRELEEESLGVFGKVEEGSIKNSLCFYTHNMLIMFIYLPVDMEETKESFKSKLGDKEKAEIGSLVWLDKKTFLDSINGKGMKMYSRVKKILSRVTEIISAL